MSGKIVIAAPDGTEVDGGDHWEFGRAPGDYRWSRFSLTFAGGGTLRLIDPRRLGRIRLDPPLEGLGPTPPRSARPSSRPRSGTAALRSRLD